MGNTREWGAYPWRFHEGQGVLDRHGNCVFDMRGWGHLVGQLGLPCGEAAKIQDDMARKIVHTMNEANKT